jgi:hypothetical protein
MDVDAELLHWPLTLHFDIGFWYRTLARHPDNENIVVRVWIPDSDQFTGVRPACFRCRLLLSVSGTPGSCASAQEAGPCQLHEEIRHSNLEVDVSHNRVE